MHCNANVIVTNDNDNSRLWRGTDSNKVADKRIDFVRKVRQKTVVFFMCQMTILNHKPFNLETMELFLKQKMKRTAYEKIILRPLLRANLDLDHHRHHHHHHHKAI